MLKVDDLAVHIGTPTGALALVQQVSFTLAAGETLGIVGESGSGKSMLSLALMGLLPRAATASGSVELDGQQLIGLPEHELCHIRGNRIGMIFQEPMTALNPAMSCGNQIAEAQRWHQKISKREARAHALELMERVGIPDARRRLDAYPHELSGGQRQRIGIAIALACKPKLLIADEPTTALDVTVQAQILDLLRDLVGEFGMGLIMISHDLGVIAETADRTLVMYAGSPIEYGDTLAVFRAPAHPYTRGLFAAMPGQGHKQGDRLATIPGTVPDPAHRPAGCAFANRCAHVVAGCAETWPSWSDRPSGQRARCHRLEELP